ncbi:MAG: FG-GAP-like repeat-containing protein [Planctomycetota bacterium]|nr:FG-GAP-like repeat-containing protein [Planctomycetota bacterium]
MSRTTSLALGIAVILTLGSGAALLLWGPWRGNGSPPAGPPRGVPFRDVSAEAGIRFRHESGARGKKYNPETFGPGATWLDYDGDDRVDLLLVNGNVLEGPVDPAAVSRLYRNLGDGRFEDVTEPAGLALPFYAMGCAVADVDNDGDPDILLYGLHRSVFLLNEGGRFRDASEASGLGGVRDWICAACFFDYDRDGRLDLFLGAYVEWTPESERHLDCNFGTAEKKYCPVAMFGATGPRLFRGGGDGTFRETTRQAGLGGLRGKALGVIARDYDRDGHPDLFVANDSVPNFLLRNRGDGTFEERGVESGFATDAGGAALAGMGIDGAWGDDGAMVVVVGNFSGEPTTFHVQEDRDFFVERSLGTPVGNRSLDRVTFGVLLKDFNLDGHVDLLEVNGHVFDVENITRIPHAQRPRLLLGGPGWEFHEVAAEGEFLGRRLLGRAAAAADYDGDGDWDLVVTVNQGAAILLRNDLSLPRRRVRVDLRGTRSNRDALGAEVTLRVRSQGSQGSPPGDRRRRATLAGASSYLSGSERQITFGLGAGEEAVDLEVLWPSGGREAFPAPSRGGRVLLVEGEGRSVDASGATPGGAPVPSETMENVVVLRRRGLGLLEAGRPRAALELFETVLEREPRDFEARRSLLVALWRLRRAADLDRAIRDVAATFPSASLLVVHFAEILRRAGYGKLARRLYLEAGRLDPERLDVWLALGNLAFDRRDHDRALECFRRALKLSPDSLEALANTGKVHTLRKNYESAVPFLEKAIGLRPDYATALSTLGGVRIAQERYGEAERLLLEAARHARSEDARLEAHGNLGILYIRLRRHERAVEHFETVLEIDPDDARARAGLDRLKTLDRLKK